MTRPAFHSGHAYEAFDQIIRRCEAWLVGKVPAIAGCDENTVRERVVQRIVEHTLNPFVSVCARRLESGTDPIPPPEQLLAVGGLTLRPVDGAVGISARLFARSLADFVFHWVLMLGAALSGFLPWCGRDRGPATVLFGVGAEGLFYRGTDARFVQFCRQGRIAPLAVATRLIIQSTERSESLSDPAFCYDRFPVRRLIRDSRLDRASRLTLLLAHLLSPFRFLGAVVRAPLLVLVGRDAAEVPAIRLLDRLGFIEAALITNAHYLLQPLWMRGPAERTFRVHEIHYAQNVKPMVYEHEECSVDHPGYRHGRVDEHWVWTPGHAAYLRGLGHKGPIHVVGPLLWYLPEPPLSRAAEGMRVAVFDVTPVRNEVAATIGLIDKYYSPRNMIRFVQDVVSVCSEVALAFGTPVHVLLKHKRAFNSNHDQQYTDLISRLATVDRVIDVVPFNENLYSLVASCDLCISVPYTSTAYVSSALGRPAIYYDPTSLVAPNFEPAPGVTLASGRAELARAINGCLTIARTSQS